MTYFKITNRTRNPYRAPLAVGEIATGEQVIPPGATGGISSEAHESAMRANPAYRALVEQRKLVVRSEFERSEIPPEAEELENTSDPKKPADLEDSPEANGAEGPIPAKVQSHGVALVEVPTAGDPPAKKSSRRK